MNHCAVALEAKFLLKTWILPIRSLSRAILSIQIIVDFLSFKYLNTVSHSKKSLIAFLRYNLCLIIFIPIRLSRGQKLFYGKADKIIILSLVLQYRRLFKSYFLIQSHAYPWIHLL